jgi:uncharacterized membrane protein YheB (UPF0754 family)
MNLFRKIFKDKLFWVILGTYLITFYFFNKNGLFLFKVIGALSIGALVGYLTNILAIWMLFNPKRKFLGFQGVIPKKRKEIAEGISTIIEKEFINPTSIRIFIEKNSDIFIDSIERFIEKQEEIKIPSIKSILGKNYNTIIKEISKNLFSNLKDLNLEKYTLKNLIFSKNWFEKILLFIWNKLKEKSLEELGINLSDIIMNNLLKTSKEEKTIENIKVGITNVLLKKVKIPFFPVETITSNFVGKLIDDFVSDFNNLGNSYVETKNFISSHVLSLKIKDILTYEQFENLIYKFIEKLETPNVINFLLLNNENQEFERIITKILDKIFSIELNITKILSIFSIDLKIVFKYLFNKYQEKITNTLESFFEKISFSEIVKEKIESYSIEEMEKVTLKVAKRELRYVEIFGIPLGMLISLFQIIF